MPLKRAVSAVLPGAYRPGLQALEKADRARIRLAKPREGAGSVEIDRTLKRVYPNQSRWDYGVGLRRDTRTVHVWWIEVHPASSSHIKDMIAKRVWLKEWLKSKAPALLSLTAPDKAYRWVASGKVAIRRGSPQHKQLAQAGIEFPCEHVTL